MRRRHTGALGSGRRSAAIGQAGDGSQGEPDRVNSTRGNRAEKPPCPRRRLRPSVAGKGKGVGEQARIAGAGSGKPAVGKTGSGR
ncbi:hypothetical protein [Azospirillum palustre]